MPIYQQIPDTPGVDLVQVATGPEQDMQQVVIRDTVGAHTDSGFYIEAHGSAGRRILLAPRAADGWERDANGRVVVVEI